jgi:hypothetical protein
MIILFIIQDFAVIVKGFCEYREKIPRGGGGERYEV